MTRGGSPEEKLRWAFKMFDKDNSSKEGVKEKCEDIICDCRICRAGGNDRDY